MPAVALSVSVARVRPDGSSAASSYIKVKKPYPLPAIGPGLKYDLIYVISHPKFLVIVQ